MVWIENVPQRSYVEDLVLSAAIQQDSEVELGVMRS